MAKSKVTSEPFAASHAAVEALRQTQWSFGTTNSLEIYELRVRLASPAIITSAKADIPVPGLPTLDGFLSFVAFRAALHEAFKATPELANELLWQWNAALHDPAFWVEFSLPLRQITLRDAHIYDCSIGLPVVQTNILIPAGAFFAHGYDLRTYPENVDAVALRRRVSQPYYRPVNLINKLEVGSGRNKALDNRMYYSLIDEFAFYFRGDKSGVERLLQFACEQRIGIGKKTTLGYGQIDSYNVRVASDISATLAQPILGGENLALVKTLPYDAVLATRDDKASQNLFGCNTFRLMNAIETLGAYRPPYWKKEMQTQVLWYGTTLIQKT